MMTNCLLKKVQHLAFTDKVKIINFYIPEKVRIFIENNFLDELKYFKKKYSIDIKMFSDHEFIIPEYKIDLLNKSKKLIKSFENFTYFNNKIKKNHQQKKKLLKKIH